ncbi:MAG: TerB family tellurite resistance protein [Opitutales bacterium]|jgi:DnaJ like chaperone protein
MAVWGKIIGGVIGSIGGPIGIGLGAALGHQFDKAADQGGQKQHVAVAYMFILVASMAKMAKADGHISKEEIERIDQFFSQLGFTGDAKKVAQEIFRKEKDSNSDIGAYFEQFSQLTKADLNQAQILYTILLEIAKADGNIHEAEIQILHLAESKLRLPVGYTDREIGSQHSSLKHAAEVLGVSESASESEIKSAYRDKCKKMHPDVLISQGLPDELVQYAGAQIQSFTEAKDTMLKASV